MKIIHFNFDGKYNTNIGDQAHVVAIQEGLNKFANDEVEIVNKPVKLLGQNVVPKLWYYPGSRHYPALIQNMYRVAIGHSNKKLIRECNEADLIIVGGGGIFMSQFMPFNSTFIRRFKSPLVLFGVGYNQNLNAPSFSKSQKRSAAKLASKASLITVRDHATHDFLKELGVASDLMCDPAIFLSETEYNAVTSSARSINIGINIAHHGWRGMDELTERIVQAYSFVIEQARLNGDGAPRFYYFVHEPGEMKVIDMFKERGITFENIIQTSDSRELKAAYRKMDLTISMMLHSTILAFGAGTPSICVGYDKKNESFMQLSKQSGRYLNVNELTGDALLETYRDSISNLADIKAEVHGTQDKLRQKYDRYLLRTLKLAAHSD